MFGERLKELRESQGMSQTDLAEHLNVSRQSVGGYENYTTIPPADIVVKIADLFNVTSDYLLGRTNEKYNFNELNADDKKILSMLYEDKDTLFKLYENKDILLKLYEIIVSHKIAKK